MCLPSILTSVLLLLLLLLQVARTDLTAAIRVTSSINTINFADFGLFIYTRSLFYKGQRENVTSPSLSKIRCCHCCIYDVIASLLLNKAPKMETSVPYKGTPYKINCMYFCCYMLTTNDSI